MALTKITSAGVADNAITSSKINDGTITKDDIASTLDLSGKTLTLPATSVTTHATTPTLDSPSITGTMSVDSGGNVTHTIANWSDDVTYVITPTNCTVGSVNASGEFVITHTSGTPSYTIKATTDSLGLSDSSTVTKNLLMNLTAPTLSSPADAGTAEDVVYTITSTDSNDDKLVLNIGSANFTYQSVSVGSASKVGNTVECTGFGTGNPAVTIQFTAEATYSVTAVSKNTAGTYGDSPASSADSIIIANFVGMVATGGTIDTDGDYKVHTFTGDGTFTVTQVGDDGTVEYLVIAGGGAGRGNNGGGGGAGGYRNSYGSEASGGGGSSESSLTVTAQGYGITVGGGGTGGTGSNGTSGFNSSFSSVTSIGGGYGGKETNGVAASGGSGGGAPHAGTVGSGTANQGYAGGKGHCGYAGGVYFGGGGGGASEVGAGGSNGGGGDGLSSSITGSAVTRAGGGAGGTHVCGGTSGGGAGGGGNGGMGSPSAGTAGTVNTGSGGGGAGNGGSSGSGGSGIVIIRYKFQ